MRRAITKIQDRNIRAGQQRRQEYRVVAEAQRGAMQPGPGEYKASVNPFSASTSTWGQQVNLPKAFGYHTHTLLYAHSATVPHKPHALTRGRKAFSCAPGHHTFATSHMLQATSGCNYYVSGGYSHKAIRSDKGWLKTNPKRKRRLAT